MHDKTITKLLKLYSHIAGDIDGSLYGAASDALMSALPRLNPTMTVKEQWEKVDRAMKDAVKDQRKLNKGQKKVTKMTTETLKKFASGKGKMKKMDWSAFYNSWLSVRGLSDSMANRRDAEDEWDGVPAVPKQSEEVSLEQPVYTGSDGDEVTLGDILVNKTMSGNPEQSMRGVEYRQELLALDGLRNEELRKALRSYLPSREIGIEEIRFAYRKALLSIIGASPDNRNNKDHWQNKFIIKDIALIAKYADVKLESVLAIRPSKARRQLGVVEKCKD